MSFWDFISRLGSKFNLRDFVGVLLVIGFMVTLDLLFWMAIPKANEQLLTYMLGQLSGFVGMVVAYHYTMNALNAKATANTGEMLRTMRVQAEGRAQAESRSAPDAGDDLPPPVFDQETTK